ncbi:RNA-binding protein cabeza-like [Daktulosphaira vitifoliae]|uniref:RNA-binding protein cabeza-like n=1 Tax=Daktulosphaira vitifoliae TaxID=58002 RepID=UPI0021AAD629|nr:RNA-binding protein cabeza-like [Daktulosphaira vitifoliae]XP_050543086.1 RNA-binding protein cabeza-like [Daktulosphaira vitifoliae]
MKIYLNNFARGGIMIDGGGGSGGYRRGRGSGRGGGMRGGNVKMKVFRGYCNFCKNIGHKERECLKKEAPAAAVAAPAAAVAAPAAVAAAAIMGGGKLKFFF